MVAATDSGALAGTNNITLTPASGTINGAATYVININKASVVLVGDGTNWFVWASYNGTVI